MTRISSRAACCAAAALFSLLNAGISHAAPYYVAWGPNLYDDTATVSQFPHALALDSRGNVFVTGHAIVSSATGFYTAKYDALDGHLVWSKALNGAGTNQFVANAIAVDSAGDCVVTGSRNVANSIDYYTVKYSGVDGALVWQKSFNGANNGEDDALKVVCDSANNAIVTGRSTGANMNGSTGFDFVTIKYKASDGTVLGMDSYTQSSSNLADEPAALAVDSSNNIYVGGSVQSALNVPLFYLRKLKAADLTKLWDIVPIDTGGEGGVTALAVDSNNSVVATGMFTDAGNHFGYYTIKFDSLGGLVWKTNNPPVSADTFGSPRPAPTGVAIDADNNPIVTGSLLDASGNFVSTTIKYTSAGFFKGATEFWTNPATDTGPVFGNNSGRAIAADSAGNAIVVGDLENEDGNKDLFVAKYDSLTGELVYRATLNGSYTSSDDKGVDVAVDQFGNIAALGLLFADKGTGIGLSEFATFKLNRFIAPTGGELPDFITGVADNAQVAVAGSPAISGSGLLATRLTFKVGKKASNALLVEGFASGSPALPAVKGQPAPVGVGESPVNWVSFSDPVVAPNGHYAFAAKVSGPAAQANGVWGNLNGNLVEILRQGSVPPIAGVTDKVASVTNIGLSSNALIALVKLTGPAATNVAVIRADNANNRALLLRTGKTDFKIDNTNTDYTIKGITLFSPAKSEAGDGRWQGAAGVVARVSVVKTSDPKSKATAIVSIANGGGAGTILVFTGQASPIAGATYSGFGFPSTGSGTQRFTFKATLAGVPDANNSALIYTLSGAAPNAYAKKGQPTGLVGLDNSITYADFSDPIVNTNTDVAFIGTLKGSPALVKPTSNKVIAFGSATGVISPIARTGSPAKDSAGNDSTFKWTAFTALANPTGTNAGPIFVGKLNTKKNNLGLWALDSSGKVRLLLRQGDKLDGQTVKKFTLLNAVSKAMAAPRSFDAAGSVAVFIYFTDGKTAIQRIGIP